MTEHSLLDNEKAHLAGQHLGVSVINYNTSSESLRSIALGLTRDPSQITQACA